MIRVSDVSKVYRDGTVANKNISFYVEKGEILGIIGTNGAGKTTLVRQIVGLSRPTSGTITIDNLKSNCRREEMMKKVSFFSQKTALLQSHTIYEVIYFSGIFRGMKKETSKEQTEDLINYFGLQDDAGKRLAYLSGGQTKLAMLASAFIGYYPIIVLDGPTNDLDPINRSRVWNLVKRYNSQHNTTFIIVSHNISELETVVRKVLIIKEGEAVDHGDIQHLKAKYNKGYHISIRCEYDYMQELIRNIHWPYIIENQNEIIISLDKEALSGTIEITSHFIKKYNAEVKIYQSTLTSIYQQIQEGQHNV